MATNVTLNDDTGLGAKRYGVLGVVADGVGILKSNVVFLLRRKPHVGHKALEHGGELLTGHRLIRTEGTACIAVDNAGLGAPNQSIRIVGGGLGVRILHAAGSLRRTSHAVEYRNCHGAGDGRFRRRFSE